MASKSAEDRGQQAADLFIPFLRTDAPLASIMSLGFKVAAWDGIVQIDMQDWLSGWMSAWQSYQIANPARQIAGTIDRTETARQRDLENRQVDVDRDAFLRQ